MVHRLRTDRSRPFCVGFLTHNWAVGRQFRHKLASLGLILGPRFISSTDSWKF